MSASSGKVNHTDSMTASPTKSASPWSNSTIIGIGTTKSGSEASSRYDAETILEHNPNNALSLDGGIPAWTVPPVSMREILAWLLQELQADELPRLSDRLAEDNLSQYALRIEANELCNQYARVLIRTMRNENNGVCWLGKFNPDFGEHGLQKYTHGMIHNFACDLVLPEFDIEIDRMLQKYQMYPEKIHLIEKIRSRVEELRGHWVYWS